jgi:hypothetical protein
MIDIRELRIGNCLNVKFMTDDFDSQVTEILIGSAGYVVGIGKPDIRYHESTLHGIPLTEEWLIKMAFRKIKKGCMSPDTYAISYTRVLVESLFEIQFDRQDTYWIEGNTIVPVSCVHSLQNLCFAITGKELTINI